MKNIQYIILAVLMTMFTAELSAHKPPADGLRPNGGTNLEQSDRLSLRAPCVRSARQRDLQLNNIQARLHVGGDIWWDRNDGRYIVPKIPAGSGLNEVSSLFCGGVWLGGFDPNGNLKVAASTYGAGGVDYYPGPLDDDTGITDAPICVQWDRFFIVTAPDVLEAINVWDAAVESGEDGVDIDMIPNAVRTWPGAGNVYFADEFGFDLPETSAGLGNFWDQNDDKIYSPENGDFPIIDIRGCLPANRTQAKELVPDEMVFWIYNDEGGGQIHGESGADQIRMEVQVQSFAYATNNEINDMTFYRYKLINRASEDIRETYFAMWVDPDLGCFTDDYSGCDVGRSLAYTYNADEVDGTSGEVCDGGVPSYGANVPIIGTDYFRGPLSPEFITDPSDGELHVVQRADSWSPFDSIPAPGGGLKGIEPGDTLFLRPVDVAAGEVSNFGRELGMSSCMIYYNAGQGNPPQIQTDPQLPEHFYNYLSARWLDGTRATFGGTGLNPGSTDFVNFVFSDAPNLAGGWSMWEERDLIQGLDTRTVQASGPFLLKPNAVNELIVGAVWVPDVRHPGPDLIKLTTADDIAQNLFDECFDIIDGPDAPTISPIELDQEIILVLNNDTIVSNNAFEAYSEIDILSPQDLPDSLKTYVFEGYKIFQLANSTVSPQELNDIDKARLVAQVDRSNGITELYNWEQSSDPNAGQTGNPAPIFTPVLQVSGADEGIQNSIRLTIDQFASEDPRLINHQEYYYMAVAYAYNEHKVFNPSDTDNRGQARPYLEGRRNVRLYTAVPRPIVYEKLNAQYGDGAVITRVHGQGSGSNSLDISDETTRAFAERYVDDLGADVVVVSDDFDGRITYVEGAGPIDVKIYNPIEVTDGRFELRFVGRHNSGSACEIEEGGTWVLTNLDTGETFESDRSIDEINEQLIVKHGISIEIAQTEEPGFAQAPNNGALPTIEEFADPDSQPWFRGISDGLLDQDVQPPFLRGLFDFIKNEDGDQDPAANNVDPNRNFNQLGNGYWVPFPLASGVTPGAMNPFLPYLSPGWITGQSDIRDANNMLRNTNNVNVVLTNDRSLWSRCFVVETASTFYGSNENLDLKIDSPSVDKDGNTGTSEADYINSTGMSWFPGYAIDVETGKRLNMFFGENSVFNEAYADIFDDPTLNVGDDMLYNPTDRLLTVNSFADFLNQGAAMEALFAGGQHYIYVTRQEYDGCKEMRDSYGNGSFFTKTPIYRSVSWASMSMMQPGATILSYSDGVVPVDMTFKLRVSKPYNVETNFNLRFPDNGCFVEDETLPVYEFEISGKQSEELTDETTETALDMINAVPNPYFAASAYENSQSDNIVKITNVPDRAIVTIYSLDGKFIVQFNRDERIIQREGSNPGVTNSQTNPDIIWDLENAAGIPVASGVYLIHINAPGLGERTIKWFGVRRKFDPSGL